MEKPIIIRRQSPLLGCLGVSALIIAFTVGILAIIFGGIRSSAVFRQAVTHAQNHPAVIEALGEPVQAGWFVSGEISTSGDSGQASLQIPLSGPEGRGTLSISASRTQGEWRFFIMRLRIRGSDGEIDLLAE